MAFSRISAMISRSIPQGFRRRFAPARDCGRDCCPCGFVLVRPGVSVDVERRLGAGMSQSGLNGLDVESVRDEQAGEVVPQAVEAEVLWRSGNLHSCGANGISAGCGGDQMTAQFGVVARQAQHRTRRQAVACAGEQRDHVAAGHRCVVNALSSCRTISGAQRCGDVSAAPLTEDGQHGATVASTRLWVPGAPRGRRSVRRNDVENAEIAQLLARLRRPARVVQVAHAPDRECRQSVVG